ncbi:MAG: acetyl-CoA carboxylase carboxyltransferase subunit [Gammaproteobacteria bacterium]|nr:MAG: acetyl-CoA carboxylase carboxyltransferase subunit [Gammaproteobacteria bacterium]
MSVFQSRINTSSAEFKQQRDDMLVLVNKMNTLCQRTAALSDKALPRFERRGQLLPRERLNRLLDPGMPFLELHNMAGYLTDVEGPETSVPGASVISGVGYVSGTRCVVFVDDSGINAGAATAYSGKKMIRAMDIARDKKLPFIHLVESAGANLLAYQVEMWMQGGAVFAGLARLSAAGVPTLVVLHGASAAGGAYMPGMSDYVIGVKGNGRAYLAGPALLKAATGEVAEDEELGGAAMHASVSGLVEYLAEDDAHGIALAREVIAALNWDKRLQTMPPRQYREPSYSPDELAGVVPCDYKQPVDVREVVARVVDGSDFLDFKPGYGAAMVCIQAKVYGMPVGIIGNNGPIDNAGATKAAQFIQLCDQADTPLVFLQNITGYMVGVETEQAGMIKHGSKMIQAVTNASVPRITFMIGASFGAGNYGMCGQGYDPDFLFTWPNAQIGVMGGESAAKTMSQVMLAGAKRKGIEVDPAQIAAQEAQIVAHYDKQSNAFYTSGRMLDDGMIDPRDTRKVLGFVLQTCWEKQHRKVTPNSFGVARM